MTSLYGIEKVHVRPGIVLGVTEKYLVPFYTSSRPNKIYTTYI